MCKCLCSVETGSRLTCITALLPKEMPRGGRSEVEKEGRKGTVDMAEVSGGMDTAEGPDKVGKKGRKRTLDAAEGKEALDTADSSKRTVVEHSTEDNKSVVKKKKRKARIV